MNDETTPVTLGSRSLRKRKRDQAVRRISRRIVHECGWLQPADSPLVRGWAQLERLASEAYERVRDEGLTRPDGTVHPLLVEITKLRRTQAALGDRLGLGPRARQELQSGSRFVPVDTQFEERVKKAHAARRGGDDDAEPVKPQ
jgi:phage terminase small subunit